MATFRRLKDTGWTRFLGRLGIPIPGAARAYLPREMSVAPPLDEGAPAGAVKRRYALLVNPFYAKDPRSSFGKHVLTPSLALTSVAGATPASWEVAFWDENLLQGAPPTDPVPQVVGITVHITTADRAYRLADWFRRRGSFVVLGGLHVQSCPDEAAAHADALAFGEGTQVWPEILRDIDRGEPRPLYRGDYRRPFRQEPSPRRSVLPREQFLTTLSLLATRGCHNRCEFCYLATKGLRMPYQMLETNQVVEQIVADDQPYAVFIDNNLGSQPDYLRLLCGAMRPIEKIWSAAVSVDIADNPSVVREMALAGCTGVFVGFESLDGANLEDAGKRGQTPDDYARRVEVFHENGIQVNGSFVLGFDHDGPEVFERTVDWIEEHRLECATFHILTPYPGTPLFRQLDRANRLIHKDWSCYDTSHVVFKPARMTAQQLADGYAWCYRRLFSHASIWKRRPANAASVMPYLLMSYLYKRSNRLWSFLIRHRMTAKVWRPIIEISRRRHLKFRERLAETPPSKALSRTDVVPAGV